MSNLRQSAQDVASPDKQKGVRWDPTFSEENNELRRQLELRHIKRQVEILATFLPDSILNLPSLYRNTGSSFSGVVLQIDITNCGKMVEKYHKNKGGGINRLTNTLNAYFGAITEAVVYFGGDVLRFTNVGFQCVWKSELTEAIHEIIHNVIVCSIYIRDTFGNFHTEVNVDMTLNLMISSGHLQLAVIGNEHKSFILLGCTGVEKKYSYEKDIVVIDVSAWGHCREDAYEVEYLTEDKVEIIRYYDKLAYSKVNTHEQLQTVQIMCQKHLKHRETLHKLRKFNDTLTDFKITESFMRDLPPRPAVSDAPRTWMTNELKPFVIDPIGYQVEEKLAVDYLTESREITVTTVTCEIDLEDVDLIKKIEEIYNVTCKYVSMYLGHVISLRVIGKIINITISFGLRGVKHELESRNALRASNKITYHVRNVMKMTNISVSVSIGFVYCGVLGHPHRREYCLIGEAYKRSITLIKHYPNQITCDYLTFKNSKLSSSYFIILSQTPGTSGQTNFSYCENMDVEPPVESHIKPMLGRESIMEFINMVIHHPHKVGYVSGLVLKAPHDMGITKILKSVVRKYTTDAYTLAAIELIGKQRPYYTVSILYNQIYNKWADIDSPNVAVIKSMPRDLWSFNEALQKNAKLNPKMYSERKYKIVQSFKTICKGDSSTNTICVIDNAQYIDQKSFDVLQAAMEEKSVRVICGGCFDQGNWDTLWKFSLGGLMKVMDVYPLPELYIAPLLCQMLNVKGVSKKLVSLIVKSCDGKPGYVQKSILRLINSGCIQMQYMLLSYAESLNELIIPEENTIVEPELMTSITAIDKLLSKSFLQDERYVIPVARFVENDTEIGNLTLDAITYEEYSMFTAYQQLVIKTSSVLGESFSRTLLVVALKYPNDQLLASSIKILFEENIFDCGTKYINCINKDVKPLICQCYDYDKEADHLFGLPPYAFCKFIFFKNKTLRVFAYNLVPEHQRRELHTKATEILEYQNNLCPYCVHDNSAVVIVMRKFDELAEACNTGIYKKPTPKCMETSKPADKRLKKIIRESILLSCQPGKRSEKPPLRKIYDSSTCFCLEMLTKVYADLVYHSRAAEHLGKMIFFLIQYSIIFLIMNEVEDCIPLLTEASELCMCNSKLQYLTEDFRKVNLGKIHMLLAEVHLILNNLAIAKNHICISLRQFDAPMIAMFYKSANSLLTTTYLERSDHLVRKPKLIPFLKYDFGICMNLVSIILYREGRYDMAKMATTKSLTYIKQLNPDVKMLCDVYSTAIELYSFCGDTHVCEQLENRINLEILKCYTQNTVIELLDICKLLYLVFQNRSLSGNIQDTLKLGYRTIEINLVCQSYKIIMDMLPIMSSLLLMAQKIEDAVQLAVMLCGYSTKYDQWALIGYFAFCLELALECSFFLEPVDKVIRFVNIYYIEENKTVATNIDNKLILLVVNYHAKNSEIQQAKKWMLFYRSELDQEFSYISVCNLMKRFENELLIIVMSLKYQIPDRDVHEKDAKFLNRQCKSAAQKWKTYYPRYLLLQAYYSLIRQKKKKYKSLLRKALKVASNRNNILEQSWITLNQLSWKSNGTSDLVEMKQYSWSLASHYSPLHWSQIMYPLPLI